MSEQSHYDVLGISRDADATEIRRAYKRKAQRYHPDKRENKAFADHKFKRIQEAYRVLSSPSARAEYNARHAFDEDIDATNSADNKTHAASIDARYYIYENWQAGPHKAVIHHAECGHTSPSPTHRRRTVMKNKNALTVRSNPGLAELKRAGNLIRITERILGKSIVPGHNRTDEQGRKQGHWVERWSDGSVFEGPYVDDKQHGHWIWRFANGNVHEGPYVDGKRHGRWVVRLADGAVFEGPYVDDKEHGHWVERFADGGVYEGPYVDGKRHGHWVERFANGDVWEGPYVDGKKHGHWVVRTPDGTEWTINWRHGEIVE